MKKDIRRLTLEQQKELIESGAIQNKPLECRKLEPSELNKIFPPGISTPTPEQWDEGISFLEELSFLALIDMISNNIPYKNFSIDEIIEEFNLQESITLAAKNRRVSENEIKKELDEVRKNKRGFIIQNERLRQIVNDNTFKI